MSPSNVTITDEILLNLHITHLHRRQHEEKLSYQRLEIHR